MDSIEAKKALDYLCTINFQCRSSALVALNRVVLEDKRFFYSPGGVERHHDYQHGLVQHVKEVMSNVCKMTGGNPSDELITAVIWHDYMKVKDYKMDKWNKKVIKLPYRNLIRHLAGSAMEFHAYAVRMPLVQETIERIEHLLLSHHGRQEWGSPVEPATAEAFILHAADMMSACGVNL